MLGSLVDLRGGSWNNNPRHCRAAYRNNNNPHNRNNNVGVRVVRVLTSHCGLSLLNVDSGLRAVYQASNLYGVQTLPVDASRRISRLEDAVTEGDEMAQDDPACTHARGTAALEQLPVSGTYKNWGMAWTRSRHPRSNPFTPSHTESTG